MVVRRWRPILKNARAVAQLAPPAQGVDGDAEDGGDLGEGEEVVVVAVGDGDGGDGHGVYLSDGGCDR